MNSIWLKTVEMPRFYRLTENIKTDVAVIGGGAAGLLCAYMLKRAGVDCVLLEAKRICSGATGNTTAKITTQHGLIYDKMIRASGAERAGLYFRANRAALDEYARLCDKIDCDFERRDFYLYSISNAKKLESELGALEKVGCRAELTRNLPLPFRTVGAVRVYGQAQINPLKFFANISRELKIYENTTVYKLRPDCAVTSGGKVYAKKFVVATHFPFMNGHGSYFLKLYQSRSYVVGLADAFDLGGMYVDEDKNGLSLRNAGGLLLLGGGSHRTGKKGGGFSELERPARSYYPSSVVACRWAAQDCISLDGVPYIGRYSANTPNIYVSTGFSKWGMTGSMTAAMLLSDLITGRDNPYARLFSPSRSMLHFQLAANAAESAVSLVTPTVPRCPHMGCALKYNAAEHSWDCPCHGSRFTEDGALIDNPAARGI